MIAPMTTISETIKLEGLIAEILLNQRFAEKVADDVFLLILPDIHHTSFQHTLPLLRGACSFC
jgi:hypothetical protein